MGSHTLATLLRSVKQGTLDPVYYLYGDEDVLKGEATRALLERAVEPSARAFNVDQRVAAELDPEAFHALVNTPPMLAARRFVVLRGLEGLRRTGKLRQELLRYLSSPNPTTVLVLVQGAGEPPDAELAEHATAVALGSLSPAQLARWLSEHARQLGVTLEPEAGELLLAAVSNDLAALAGELEKLAAAAAGSRARAVTRDDVTQLVGVRRGETLEDLVDAVLERRAGRAAELVGVVFAQAGLSGVRIVTPLATALVGTALARAELTRGAPPARLPALLLAHLRATRPFGVGSWEATAARWARWAAQWSAAELLRALRLALSADRALKSSTVSDERGIVEQLVLSLALVEQVAA